MFFQEAFKRPEGSVHWRLLLFKWPRLPGWKKSAVGCLLLVVCCHNGLRLHTWPNPYQQLRFFNFKLFLWWSWWWCLLSNKNHAIVWRCDCCWHPRWVWQCSTHPWNMTRRICYLWFGQPNTWSGHNGRLSHLDTSIITTPLWSTMSQHDLEQTSELSKDRNSHGKK